MHMQFKKLNLLILAIFFIVLSAPAFAWDDDCDCDDTSESDAEVVGMVAGMVAKSDAQSGHAAPQKTVVHRVHKPANTYTSPYDYAPVEHFNDSNPDANPDEEAGRL